LDNTALALRTNDLVLAGPAGSLGQYIHAVGGIPILSVADEQTLARRYRDDADIEAARHLVLAHLRFVVHIARSYNGYGLALGDLVQEGNVGLMKAVKRFDPDKGVRLVSFAVHWIRAEIHEFVLRNWRLVKVATTKAQRKLFFNLRKAKSHLGWLNHAETTAIASDLGVSTKEVTEMEKRLAARDLSFDPTPNDDEDYTPQAYLASSEPDPAAMVEAEDWEAQTHTELMASLGSLDARSQDILKRRWLAEKKATLHELAAEHGVSAERIRQIEAASLKKLRGLMAPA
jgi:RNA polymerase sigma-32 factor